MIQAIISSPKKAKWLSWKEEMLQKLKGEQELTTWAVELQRKGRYNELKKSKFRLSKGLRLFGKKNKFKENGKISSILP